MSPKFIYFDMGNVLLHFSHERQAEQIARLCGQNAAEIYRVLYQDGLHWLAERGEAPPEAFHAQFCSRMGTKADRTAFEAASNDIFWPNTSIVPLVAQLRGGGYRLGVLSNTSQAHWEFCRRRFRLMEMFHVYALSFDIGVMKPDAKIYSAAARLAGVQPAEIFFTDDRADNVAAAKAAGWDAVVFESTGQLSRELRQRGVLTNY
jgi:putative hydrolase of the HAD superfamily